MKFVFYSNSDFINFLNLPVKQLDQKNNDFFRLGRHDDTASPPVPSNIFTDIPKDANLLYDIFSLDCCLSNTGKISCEKISEEEALAKSSVSKIFCDDFSSTAYFRYNNEQGQHTVWLEDTYHTIQKIKILSEMGFKKLGLVINSISIGTIINLIHADCGSI